MRAAFAQHGGHEIDTQGDSFFVVFRRAKDAVEAAAAAQRALRSHVWPEGNEVRVRMGIHTGQAEASGGSYHGLAVHRAARIGAAGHGGQVLVSQTTREPLEDEEDESDRILLRDLGEQRLKDLDRPVRLYQLIGEELPVDFPPLRTVAPEPERSPAAGVKMDWRGRLPLVVPAVLAAIGTTVAAGLLLRGGDSDSARAAGSVAADSVGVFSSSGKLLAEVPVGTGPASVAIGESSIWAVNVDAQTVSRIDPKTNAVVQTIPVGSGPAGVAVGGGFVWVANSTDGTVSKIDPRTNEVVQWIQVGNGPAGIVYGGGWIWVANSSDRTVVRISPATGVVGKTIPVEEGADGIAIGAGAVWVTSVSAGTVTRIDSQRGSVIDQITAGRGAGAVAVGAGSVWVANSLDGTVSRIDPSSNRVAVAIPVGEGPTGVAVAPDGRSVWVSNEQGGTLSKIEPAQDRVVRTVATGNRPAGVAVASDGMYVAVRTTGLAHRGGTLTVVRGSFDWSIDPVSGANAFDVLILTNDGLVAYKRVGGSDGARLVPDLATSLPVPTDGGRTYRFQLRRGIRYSTGALVRPADFRRAIERVFEVPDAYGGFLYTGIIGAKACVVRKRCDLSRGIVDDPGANSSLRVFLCIGGWLGVVRDAVSEVDAQDCHRLRPVVTASP